MATNEFLEKITKLEDIRLPSVRPGKGRKPVSTELIGNVALMLKKTGLQTE